jgi:hypothetical protein
MRKVINGAICFWIVALCACTSTAKLIGIDPAPDYFTSKYSIKDAATIMNAPSEYGFDEFMRTYKEGILNNSTLSQDARESQYAKMTDFKYADHLYLRYIIRLRTPAPLNVDEFNITLTDDVGQSVSCMLFGQSVKAMQSNQYGSSTYYLYEWLMRLEKPFVKENYKRDKYVFIVTYPNGALARYEVMPSLE